MPCYIEGGLQQYHFFKEATQPLSSLILRTERGLLVFRGMHGICAGVDCFQWIYQHTTHAHTHTHHQAPLCPYVLPKLRQP
ncbi:hypothetical protein FKM82_028157 [Ascaphus truei]